MSNNKYKEIKTYEEMSEEERKEYDKEEKVEQANMGNFFLYLIFMIVLIMPIIGVLSLHMSISEGLILYIIAFVCLIFVIALGYAAIKELILVNKRNKEDAKILNGNTDLNYSNLVTYKDELDEEAVLKSKTGKGKFEKEKESTGYKDLTIAFIYFFISIIFSFYIILVVIPAIDKEERYIIAVPIAMFLSSLKRLIDVAKNLDKEDEDKKDE